MNHDQSQAAFQRAQRLLPGGVNSPARAFGAVGGEPIFFVRAEGAYLYDIDGNQYIDFMLAYGALPLGHAHPRIVETVREAIGGGSLFATASAIE